MPEPVWMAARAELALPPAEVHVWRASLEQPAGRVQLLAETLSADERERAGRFRFERDRRRYVVGRGTLRLLLGRYLGMDPGEVRFAYAEHGKPRLAEVRLAGDVRFSVAHSHEMALLAFSPARELGVDLEWMRPLEDADQIARRFFSADEVAAYRSLPAETRLDGFYLCWTRKEAYLKATGGGLVGRLERFTVSLAPGRGARLVSALDDDPGRWTMVGLEPEEGYAAALVAEGHDWRLLTWDCG